MIWAARALLKRSAYCGTGLAAAVARIKAPLAQRRSRFLQGLNKGIRPRKKAAQRVGCERSTLRLSGVSAWRHQSQGSNEILPAEGPSLVISLRPLLASQSCFTGDGGRALPNATSPGKRGQTGPVSSVNGGKKKKKIPPPCILWSWGLCPHFPEADN